MLYYLFEVVPASEKAFGLERDADYLNMNLQLHKVQVPSEFPRRCKGITGNMRANELR